LSGGDVWLPKLFGQTVPQRCITYQMYLVTVTELLSILLNKNNIQICVLPSGRNFIGGSGLRLYRTPSAFLDCRRN